MRGSRGYERDDWLGQLQVVENLRIRAGWIDWRDNNADGEESEVENRDVEGVWRDDESAIASGEAEARAKGGGKGCDTADELGVENAAGGGGVDEGGIGMRRRRGGEEREDVAGNGDVSG